ncbi:hypothetical protein COCNU_06G012180 [Cocos nucifera]|uniref:Uncharacterized protein n=1 Tax=Cocos nucifera TaxID=13894 RepID=A0A8K0IBN0_COCNU|nr:hypothetical protein COCNU_06G012180 [Cocos nucifera]
MGERKHEDPNHVTASHHDLLTSILGSKENALSSIVYSYRHGFSGFAAMLTESQAELLADSPEVISVKPSRTYELHTTRSWDFLGLNHMYPTELLLKKSNFGDGVIIGMVDTGICQVGEAFDANNCSRKIIGARYYTAGISDRNLKLDFLSPRGANSHGTFTASTAAGSIVENVSFHGLGAGVARGGAPRARLAIYKAVWGTARGRGAGNSATVLKAIDDAIHDGVDILSLSLTVDEESFGSLHAVAEGITVVYSAGNQGPMPQTLSNTAPWVITVAASTIDRSFPTGITLGNQSFVGQSIFYNSTKDPRSNFKPLVYGDSCAENSLNGINIAGTVVLCVAALVSPTSLFSTALSNVLKAGVKGKLLCLILRASSKIREWSSVLTYLMGSSRDPMVSVELTRNVVGKEVLSPKVAAFSSRGPAILFAGLLKLYIVYMGERKHEDPQHVTASHHDMLTSLLGSKEEALGSIVYSYRHGFSGFAAMLAESQAKLLAESPEVISIRPSRNYQLQTTRSWNFLGLNHAHPTKLLRKSNFGDGVIIGIIDTGIWPESKSFNDDGYGPIPSRWKGKCEVGEAFGINNCSRKIIGAQYYIAGIDKENLKSEYLSPRDSFGHGTHTASIAAGSVVENVSFHGLAAGVARGGAPKARLAIYKAVWKTEGGNGGGNSATVLKAIDDAIHDGVDILSLSLAVEEDSFGALHAVARGITVVYAAGNSGPIPQTLYNTAPWVITVAASTIDRSFPTVITLGDHRSFVGQSIFYNTTKCDRNKHKYSHGWKIWIQISNGSDLEVSDPDPNGSPVSGPDFRIRN